MRENEKESKYRNRKRWKEEEEEEDREIRVYYQRLEYMLDSCSEYDVSICRLIEDQQGMLSALCMKKREFLNEVDIFMRL